MENNAFGYGNKPTMKEVPAGTEAIFSFNGDPTTTETKWGTKFSFPIKLYFHDSYPQIEEEGEMNMDWESKSQCAEQLYEDLINGKELDWHKDLVKYYNNNKWQLTRFDGGAYYITVLK
jgi:hypothetical protein